MLQFSTSPTYAGLWKRVKEYEQKGIATLDPDVNNHIHNVLNMGKVLSAFSKSGWREVTYYFKPRNFSWHFSFHTLGAPHFSHPIRFLWSKLVEI